MSRQIPDHVCFIDLETLPGDATVGMDLERPPGWEEPSWEERVAPIEGRKSPAYGGNQAKLDAWAEKEAERVKEAEEKAQEKAQDSVASEREAYASKWRKGSLSAFKGRIACISYAFGDGQVEVIDCAEDEEAGMRELGELAVDRISHGGARMAVQWVAHNGSGFDFPMVQLRALHHGSTALARRFHQEKPWDERAIDTALWVPKLGGGWKGAGTKLGDVCKLLGIDHDADNPIDGSQVLDAYVEGRWDEVIAHAAADVRDLRKLYRILWEVRR